MRDSPPPMSLLMPLLFCVGILHEEKTEVKEELSNYVQTSLAVLLCTPS